MRVSLISLGCKVNQAEIENWQRQLHKRGAKIVDFGQEADFYIINTCSVTHLADKKSRQKIRQVLKTNNRGQLIVTGCLAHWNKRAISQISPRIIIINNFEKDYLIDFLPLDKKVNYCPNDFNLYRGRTRTLIKIQDGCDNFCAYCLIPYVRGPKKSFPPQRIISAICQREKEGYKEVVLTGVNIGKYNWQEKKTKRKIDLVCLIKSILEKTKSIRIRLSSIEPVDFNQQLLFLFQNKRLCRHLHLPLQTGADELLKKMGRDYTTDEFSSLVKQIKNKVPEMAITTDLIIGLPYETEKLFKKTYSFVAKLDLAKIHLFKYSPRPFTKAALMSHQVNEKIKYSRYQKMAELARRLQVNYQKKFLGRYVKVLFEQKRGEYWEGLTDNYLKVKVKNKKNLRNEVRKVFLKKITSCGILGELNKS